MIADLRSNSRLHSWLPVALALVVAVAAGWSIMRLSTASYHASGNERVVPDVTADVERPVALLLTTARARLAADGVAAMQPTPGAPPQMAAYYTGTFNRLAELRRTSGEHQLVDAVSDALAATAVTQDAIYAGGAPSIAASRRAPAARAALHTALAALDRRLQARALLASRFADGGTMLIMLLGALSLIVLLRRFDRMRGRFTDELHEQAMHDPLTGLPNRRQLAADLGHALHSATIDRPARVVVFDLDGFKAYNDAFGHHGGDLLLTRLARALAAASAPAGTSYRLGGDEFCTLFADGADDAIVARCVEALSEAGDAFVIASSYGSVLLPTESVDSDHAMQIADERMYAQKNSSRASAGQQTRNLALKVLSIQEPDVEHHSVHVAALADAIGRRLGLGDGPCAELVRAAELHDIGKIAIPYAVLHKTAPLDTAEWEMMRRHPTIGANILSAAPALGKVAEIVRHSHERFDGHGYPAGLAGDAIPLASRIVFVCDSFDAMVSKRPYSTPMSDEGALEQLRRNAGTQFDPAVVEAFCAEHRETHIREPGSTSSAVAS